jgi:hypothetical protein
MIVKAKFTFYDITACGYFSQGAEEPLFGNISSILHQLKCWATSPQFVLRDTCTYEVSDGCNALKTFCFDIAQCSTSGDYLLTTWNEIPSTDGKTATVNGGDRVGVAHVDLTDLPADGIPGYPTYFWFLPKDKLFATVTLNQIFNGHPNLLLYLNGFIRTFSDHVCREPNGEGVIEVCGYHQMLTDPPEKIYPRFQSSLHHNRASIDYIRTNRQSIRKYVRKMIVHPDVERDISFFRRLYEHATGLDQQNIIPDPVKLRYEISETPSEEELEAMIAEWQHYSYNPTRWDDVGFQLSNDDQTIRWLSYSLARMDFDMDIPTSDDGVPYQAQSLLDAIRPQRDSIRSIVRDL